jgi:exopolyphosphatase/guanosine-5'-triphosphate,3'-diphosphate pyrophosphatase
MILAAIDIGSNAARLLISQTDEANPAAIQTLSLDRIGLGLGFDVFETGAISPARERPLLEAMQAFRKRMTEFNVTDYRAYATAAMRNAANATEIIHRIAQATGIEIEVISGEREADINFLNHEQQGSAGAGVFIDVGGGSTELTVFLDKQSHARRSFNIGAIRVFKGQVSEENWEELQSFLRQNIKPSPELKAYGTGGSISKLFSISKLDNASMMPLAMLNDKIEELKTVSVADRINVYGIEPDRAELIVPALGIFSRILNMAGIDGIYAHRAGLASGMIRSLAKELTA